MRQQNQHFNKQHNFHNPDYLKLLQNIQKDKQQTSAVCHSGYEQLQNLMMKNNQSTQNFWNVYQLGIYRTDYKTNKVKQQIDILDKQLIKIQVSIKLKKFMKQLAEKQLQQVRQLNKVSRQAQSEMITHFNKSIDEVNQRQLRKRQIQMKINHNHANKSNINQGSKQILDRRIFKNNRLSDWLSSNKDQNDLAFKQIQINSDRQQVIFRIQSQKLYQFILILDQEEDKFILKNPYQKLESVDLLAVKTFNVHQDPIKLLKDFKVMVLKSQSHL